MISKLVNLTTSALLTDIKRNVFLRPSGYINELTNYRVYIISLLYMNGK